MYLNCTFCGSQYAIILDDNANDTTYGRQSDKALCSARINKKGAACATPFLLNPLNVSFRRTWVLRRGVKRSARLQKEYASQGVSPPPERGAAFKPHPFQNLAITSQGLK